MSFLEKLTEEKKPIEQRYGNAGAGKDPIIPLDELREANRVEDKARREAARRNLGKFADKAGVVRGRDSEVAHTTGEVPVVDENSEAQAVDVRLGETPVEASEAAPEAEQGEK